jgi:hypothetical protein
MVNAQMKIQQMAIMILAVFLFFILAGLFILTIQSRGLFQNYDILQKNKAITSLKSISGMTEFACDFKTHSCLDEDKLLAMAELSRSYSGFWSVSSIEVYKIYPAFSKVIDCPNTNCNHYKIYNSGKNTTLSYSTLISICKKARYDGSPYEVCEIGKLVVGVS